MEIKKIVQLTAISSAVIIGFVGCGSDSVTTSSTTSSSSNTSSSSSSSGTTTSTTGIVSGSFYAGASCCFDKDSDGTCNSDSVVASKSDGSFTLDGSANYNIVCSLNGATKHTVIGDTGIAADSNLVFRIRKEAIDSITKKFIVSAISTKLWNEMENDSTLTFSQAKTKIANRLGIDENMILRDFNNDNSLDASIKTKLQTETDNIRNLMAKASGDINASSITNYVSSIRLPSRIDAVK